MNDKKQGGRPSKINPARLAKILKSIEAGNYFNVAAPASGVEERTAHRWKALGEQALARVKNDDPDIEDAIDDWLQAWPDNFNANNPLWDAPPPSPFEPAEWLFVLFFILNGRASARAEAKAVQHIRSAGKKNWQSAAWYLERTHANRYGRNQIIQHTGADGGAIQIEAASPEVVLAELADLKRLREANKNG